MRKVFEDYLSRSNEFQIIFFKIILENLDKNKQLDLLEEIILKYPNWDMSNLNLDLFCEKYINCFGIHYLANNIKDLKKNYLEYGLKDGYIKERMTLLSKYNVPIDNINSQFLLNDIVSNNDIKKISTLLKDQKFSHFICNYCIDDSKYFEKILKATNKNSKYYKLIRILLNKFETKDYCYFKKILDDENISEYLSFFQNIEVSWFDTNCSFESFLKISNKNKKLFNNINYYNKEVKKNLKVYFYDDLLKINSIEELDKIKTIRTEKFKDILNSNDNISDIKNIITKCYFNLEYKVFEAKINDIEENIIDGLKLTDYNFKNFKMLEQIVLLNDKSSLIELFDKINNIPNIYEYMDILDKVQKSYCFKDIVSSLTNVGNGYQIIEFNGQDFNFLIHKIKGYGNRKFANKLFEDPSLWNSNFVEDSYISTSMITNDYLGCIPGIGYMLAFNNIDSELINDMGPSDISYSTRSSKNKIKLPKSRILTRKNLINKSTKLYNEVALKRYNQNIPTMPSAVVVFDKVTEKSISVAKYFDIPIYVINREKYLEKMLQKCDEYLKNCDYDNYCNQRLKIALSFNEEHKIMEKYFSNDKLNENTNLIINKIISEIKRTNTYKEKEVLKEKLKKMISVNYKINSIMMYNEMTYNNYEFDENQIEKQLLMDF